MKYRIFYVAICAICSSLFIASCGGQGGKTLTAAEYEEYMALKNKYGAGSQKMSMSLSAPPTSAYNQVIDTNDAHCLIKKFYNDTTKHLMTLTPDSEYVEIRSFLVTREALNYFIGSDEGELKLDAVRFYFGEEIIDNHPVHSVILVGAEEAGMYRNGEPMYNNVKTSKYYDMVQPCPKFCSDDTAMTGQDIPQIFKYATCGSGGNQ